MKGHGSINSVVLMCAQAQAGRPMHAHKLFLEYKNKISGIKEAFNLCFSKTFSLPFHLFIIHLGFPCTTRHMFVTLLYKRPPLRSDLPHLHAVPLYS